MSLIKTITVNNRVATYHQRGGPIVCDNTGYTIKFIFSDEWSAHTQKTARFVWGGGFVDVTFSGDECPVPPVTGAQLLRVGVYAGDVKTTTDAVIPCLPSIKSSNDSPRPEQVEQYRDRAEAAAARAEEAAATAAQEAAAGVAADLGAVLYTQQKLTETQKAQARDNIGAADISEVNAVVQTISGLADVDLGGNLFDKNAATIGVYCKYSSGEELARAKSFATDFIPVEKGKTYASIGEKSYFGNNCSQPACFNANKEFIGYLGYIDGTTTFIDDSNPVAATYYFTVSSDIFQHMGSGATVDDVAYVRVNYLASAIDTFMVVEGNTYPTEYKPYGTKVRIKQEAIPNVLTGKKISLNGDSICKGSGYEGGYGKIIADRNGMMYQNIAVAGGTIMRNPDNPQKHCISETISNMDADADYIILEGGVNDAGLSHALGTITEGFTATLDTTTYAGAFENMLKQAILRFPGKKIGFVIVHKMTSGFLSTDDFGTEETYYTIAKKCCHKWGVPYIDLNATTPLSRYIPELRDAYTMPHATLEQGDGWHPNEEGYKKYYCDKIEAWMKSL